MTGYAELVAASNFSFLRGASHPEELAGRAAELGYKALAICDRNTVAGVVRAHKPTRALGLKYIPGCRLVLQEGL
jgi:error-prone DNA polymerase